MNDHRRSRPVREKDGHRRSSKEVEKVVEDRTEPRGRGHESWYGPKDRAKVSAQRATAQRAEGRSELAHETGSVFRRVGGSSGTGRSQSRLGGKDVIRVVA